MLFIDSKRNLDQSGSHTPIRLCYSTHQFINWCLLSSASGYTLPQYASIIRHLFNTESVRIISESKHVQCISMCACANKALAASPHLQFI